MGTMIERTKEHVVGHDWTPIGGGDMVYYPHILYSMYNHLYCAFALCMGWHIWQVLTLENGLRKLRGQLNDKMHHEQSKIKIVG